MGRVSAVHRVPGSANQHRLAPALAPGQELQLLQRVLEYLDAAVVQKPASRDMLLITIECLWLAATQDIVIATVTLLHLMFQLNAYAVDNAGETDADPMASRFSICFTLPCSPKSKWH